MRSSQRRRSPTRCRGWTRRRREGRTTPTGSARRCRRCAAAAGGFPRPLPHTHTDSGRGCASVKPNRSVDVGPTVHTRRCQMPMISLSRYLFSLVCPASGCANAAPGEGVDHHRAEERGGVAEARAGPRESTTHTSDRRALPRLFPSCTSTSRLTSHLPRSQARARRGKRGDRVAPDAAERGARGGGDQRCQGAEASFRSFPLPSSVSRRVSCAASLADGDNRGVPFGPRRTGRRLRSWRRRSWRATPPT